MALEETVPSYFLDRHIASGGEHRCAFRTATGDTSYGELFRLSCRYARVLNSRSFRSQDRIVFLLPDSPLYVALVFGTCRFGAIAVPLSTRLSYHDYRSIFSSCRPAAVVFSEEMLEMVDSLKPGFAPSTVFWISAPKSAAPWATPVLAELAAASPTYDTFRVRAEHRAVMQYTSGSTGHPKGVVHTHKGIVAIRNTICERLALSQEDLCYSTAKLSFGYGFGNSILIPFAAGASTLLDESSPEPGSVLEWLLRFRPSIFFSTPRLYASLLTVITRQHPTELSFIRLCVSAGEHLSCSLFERWKTLTGLEIMDGIGATECLHIYISGVPGQLVAGSTGRPVPGCQARLMSENKEITGPNETGELWISSECNSSEYWGDPTETNAAMEAGWVRTGDLFKRSPEDLYFYRGRTDDVVKIGALKVAPIEVEQRLKDHQDVSECIVVGLERQGVTELVAYVCLRNGVSADLTSAARLREFVACSLARHKVPAKVVFVADLPRTATGKLDRAAAKRVAAGG